MAAWLPRHGHIERRIALKLTLDSSEPLADAMRVLGALYGVTLVVSPDEQDATKPGRKTASTPSRKSASKPAGSKRTARRAPSAARKAPPVVRSTEAAAARSEQKTARRSAGSLSNAEVRSWARQNGLTVSNRGRLPASVMTAYRNAQSA
jgi:hypothetical protein